MSKVFYLPRGDKERESWLNNFAVGFETLATSLGFTTEEIEAVNNYATAFSYVLKAMNLSKSETQEWTQYKNLLSEGAIGSHLGSFPGPLNIPPAPTAVPAGIFKRITKIVQRVKKHPNYDESIGRILGIIGPEKKIDYDNAKVQVKLKRSDHDGVVLDFVKNGFDSVIVYSGSYFSKTTERAGNEATIEEQPVMTWTEIGRAAISPFVDTRKNNSNKPETRYYKFRYILKEQLLGKDSDIITVIANIGTDLKIKLK